MNLVNTIAKIIPLLDLTVLDEKADVMMIEHLCQRAKTPLGQVAAVCIYPDFIGHARHFLHDSNIAVATVINFPEGVKSLAETQTEIALALTAGAQELDIAIPYQAYLNDNRGLVQEYLAAWRTACPIDVPLKIILETGALLDPELIQIASLDALVAGADFIKTSTGKIEQGANLAAAEVMLQAIKMHGKGGIKLSGGVRTTEQAQAYVDLAERIMGNNWVKPETFRIGASALLDDLLQILD